MIFSCATHYNVLMMIDDQDTKNNTLADGLKTDILLYVYFRHNYIFLKYLIGMVLLFYPILMQSMSFNMMSIVQHFSKINFVPFIPYS